MGTIWWSSVVWVSLRERMCVCDDVALWWQNSLWLFNPNRIHISIICLYGLSVQYIPIQSICNLVYLTKLKFDFLTSVFYSLLSAPNNNTHSTHKRKEKKKGSTALSIRSFRVRILSGLFLFVLMVQFIFLRSLSLLLYTCLYNKSTPKLGFNFVWWIFSLFRIYFYFDLSCWAIRENFIFDSNVYAPNIRS